MSECIASSGDREKKKKNGKVGKIKNTEREGLRETFGISNGQKAKRVSLKFEDIYLSCDLNKKLSIRRESR